MLYLNLARLWVQKGERGKAKDLMQALLARKPDSQTASKALEQLRDR
jgi:hypothetical protein